MKDNIHFIDDQNDFDQLMTRLAKVDYIGFDTEFVGERTYLPILCLLQVVHERDIYLIDTLSIRNLQAFLDIVAGDAVLKITHAGDNDYRLLYNLYQTLPDRIFDIQIAAGFVGHNYPASFGRIVERELRYTLSKSHAVTNWEKRPLDPKALEYAVEDVKYLPELYHKLQAKLTRLKRENWVWEEMEKWKNPDFYKIDAYREATQNEFIYQLKPREQLFLYRLYRWRRERATQLNVPKDNALQNRHIANIVKTIKNGAGAFKNNRTLQEYIWKPHLSEWLQLWETPPDKNENEVLRKLKNAPTEDANQEWVREMLYHLVRFQSMAHGISPALLLPRSDFNKLKNPDNGETLALLTGWRAELLGPSLTQWLRNNPEMTIEWTTNGLNIHARYTDE